MLPLIRLGTRASKLALAQSHQVAARLSALGAEVQLVTIATTGDRALTTPPNAGLTGIFVKELENALIVRAIDLAVHSLKDMTTTLPAPLIIGAILPRASALDALIGRERGCALDDLPPRARIGTSSPRRRAQLLHYRRDLDISPLRGNVDTRLRKLDAGECDAIVLAQAGLERLGVEDLRPWVIPAAVCLPAPGQGALAVEIRADDPAVATLVRPLDDPATRACVTAERAFLRALGGGCRAAVGALGWIENDLLRLEGAVAHPEGAELLRACRSGAPEDPGAVGEALAGELRRRGAERLIEDFRG